MVRGWNGTGNIAVYSIGEGQGEESDEDEVLGVGDHDDDDDDDEGCEGKANTLD